MLNEYLFYISVSEARDLILLDLTIYDFAINYIILYVIYKAVGRYIYFKPKEHASKINRTFLLLSLTIVITSLLSKIAALMPIQPENRWFFKDPEYSLSIIKHLFKEKSFYPRTSVGNLLSDWSKKYPEIVYEIVEELVAENDKNSYWIAYRACRNLVKKEPERVMDLLKTDEYKYKKNIYKRTL